MSRILPRKLVVAGLMVDGERILVSQRRPGGPLGLKWEFPGGKIEAGESPAVALARELREELGCATEVGRVWDVLHAIYPDFELLMLVYHARLLPGETPECRDVEAFRWCTLAECRQIDILEADAPLIHRLTLEGIPVFVASLPRRPEHHYNSD